MSTMTCPANCWSLSTRGTETRFPGTNFGPDKWDQPETRQRLVARRLINAKHCQQFFDHVNLLYCNTVSNKLKPESQLIQNSKIYVRYAGNFKRHCYINMFPLKIIFLYRSPNCRTRASTNRTFAPKTCGSELESSDLFTSPSTPRKYLPRIIKVPNYLFLRLSLSFL